MALLMALVLVFAMTACTTTETPAESPAADGTEPAATDDGTEESPAAEPSGDVYTLTYYMYGMQDNAVRESVQNAINEHIEPLIGANINFVVVSAGDWNARAVTALQAGEKIDIFFTADWQGYVNEVTRNLLLPLNDDNGQYGNLLEQYGQGILESLNPAFITGTQMNGINYAVPTNKELCVPMGFIVNMDAANEVGLTDLSVITCLEDFEPYLAAYKELHPEQYGYLNDGGWGDEPWVANQVNGLTGNLIAQKYDPDENGVFDETWYSVWETEENKAHVETMYKWFQAGYVHPDSPLTSFDVNTSAPFAAGEWLFISAPLKGENIKAQEMMITSGNLDLNLQEIYMQGKVCITTHAGGSMLAIPVTSEDPVKAMQYINLMHTDTELLDMMLFGVQGVQWEFAEDGRVELLDPSWYGVHGGAWTMGNTAIQDVTTDEDPEKNQKLQEYSADAIMHPSLGFRYIVPVELETQLAAVVNVQDAMNRSLLTGAVDPSTALPQYISDLKAAGLDELKADIERQYNEWKATKDSTATTDDTAAATDDAAAATDDAAAADDGAAA
ncbi:MAG: ABC transporter substrate-binding protein [Candidatus Spyradocola sp.]